MASDERAGDKMLSRHFLEAAVSLWQDIQWAASRGANVTLTAGGNMLILQPGSDYPLCLLLKESCSALYNDITIRVHPLLKSITFSQEGQL